MKPFMTSVAVAALIGISPAFAGGAGLQLAQTDNHAKPTQTMDGTAACAPGATETADGKPCPPDAAAAPTGDSSMNAAQSDTNSMDSAGPAEPAMTGALPDDGTADATGAAPATDMAAATGQSKFIKEQDAGAVLASELIGQNVYSPANETLGDVNDVVWSDEDGIQGLVVGVGGFLGIGEKEVAVSYDAFDIRSDGNGGEKLVLSATADELAAAPDFLTNAEKLAMLQSEQQKQALPPATSGGVAPATVPEPAPAQ
jgi:sporulation protein YlmC with PRC-barrel domain